ncbi:MAG: DUF1566 domain-containing protein [Chlamydiae bacterium]|nr:DUF1566 domain-containing protein [Chlamydiota bacterium]
MIFYLTPDGRHGLVVSVVDMKDSLNSYLINWSPDKTPIGAKGNFLMFGEDYTTAGKLNTELIVKNYSPASNNYAAKACMNYSYQMNGVTYDDWYLPSLIELGLILEMNAEINTALGSISGSAQLSTGVYWSSFEYNTDIALAWDFSGEGQSSKEKNPASPECRVRAVRAF